MDICFKAFQGETTGEMIADATTPPPARRRPLARSAFAPHFVYGDLCGLATWFVISMRPGEPRSAESSDVAA
jgi:hypothetical protein